MAYTLTYSFSNNAYSVTGYTGTPDNVTIPNTYDDGTQGEYPVTSIGVQAFRDCSSITSATIGNNVTSIGVGAFGFCTGLASITIGNSLTSIDNNAFYDCSSLTKVNYLGTVDQWAQISFGTSSANPLYYAHNLYIDDVLVTNAVLTTATKISDDAFYRCDSLTSITIGNSVTSIGVGAFYNCNSLTKMICCPTTPPTIGTGTISSATTKIIVPEQSETAYKTALNWSSYASIIIGDNNYFNFLNYTNVIKTKTKTINGNSIWGSGDISVSGGTKLYRHSIMVYQSDEFVRSLEVVMLSLTPMTGTESRSLENYILSVDSNPCGSCLRFDGGEGGYIYFDWGTERRAWYYGDLVEDTVTEL